MDKKYRKQCRSISSGVDLQQTIDCEDVPPCSDTDGEEVSETSTPTDGDNNELDSGNDEQKNDNDEQENDNDEQDNDSDEQDDGGGEDYDREDAAVEVTEKWLQVQNTRLGVCQKLSLIDA